MKLTVSISKLSLEPAMDPEISRTQTKSIGARFLLSYWFFCWISSLTTTSAAVREQMNGIIWLP